MIIIYKFNWYPLFRHHYHRIQNLHLVCYQHQSLNKNYLVQNRNKHQQKNQWNSPASLRSKFLIIILIPWLFIPITIEYCISLLFSRYLYFSEFSIIYAENSVHLFFNLEHSKEIRLSLRQPTSPKKQIIADPIIDAVML